MSKQSTNTSNRIDVFDGLKGISILMILIYYFYQHILPGGYLAVNLFLFIAGFFNFRHFYIADLQGKSINFLDYYKKRLSRLFFPMLAMILSTASFILLFARDYFFNLRNMAISSLLFFNNFYQIFNEQSYFIQAANPSAFTHLWYVSILGQLILFTPVLMMLFYSWHKRPTVTVNMLLILSLVSAFLMGYLYKDGSDPSGVYYSVFTRAFAYTLGGAVGLLFPARLSAKPMYGKVKWIFNVLGLVVVVLMFFMLKFMYGTQAFAYRFGMSLFTVLSALLVIVSIHPSSIWNKIFSFPLFNYMGKRSFSYYLWFYPVYLIVPSILQRFNMNSTFSIILQFVLIFLLAEISYQLFERNRISLPIGQDFNWQKSKYQLNYLRTNKDSLLGVKVLTIAYIVNAIIGAFTILAASENRAETAQELQTVIEENQRIAEETQTQDTENVKLINNIEGLNQQEMLYANGLDLTFIGDSVLLAATEQLRNVFPKAVIDGEVGRQLYNSVAIVQGLTSQQKLRPTVITILGSNGTFTAGQLNDFIDSIGIDKDIYFVTSDAQRSWVADANQQLIAAAQRYGNVHIIDWYSYANDHDEWRYDDKAHPTKEGAEELSVFIAKEIYRQR